MVIQQDVSSSKFIVNSILTFYGMFPDCYGIEPPDPPQDVKALDIKERKIRISWMAPYSGNSPIVKYIVQYRNHEGEKHLLLVTYRCYDVVALARTEFCQFLDVNLFESNNSQSIYIA